MKSVHVQKSTTRKDDEQDETTTDVTETSRVSEEAQDLLDEIDCCLAENTVDPDAAIKAQAKAEWEQLMAGSGSPDESDDIMEQYYVWMGKYSHLFEFCCGLPKFDD